MTRKRVVLKAKEDWHPSVFQFKEHFVVYLADICQSNLYIQRKTSHMRSRRRCSQTVTDLAVLSSDGEFGPTDFRTEGNLSARIHELEPKAKELEMLRAKLHRMQALGLARTRWQ